MCVYLQIRCIIVDISPMQATEWGTCSLPLSLSIPLSLFSASISRFSLSGKQKTAAAIATESKRKTWPGPVTFGASWLVEGLPCELCCRVDGEAGSSLSVAVDAELSQQSYLSSPVRADLLGRLGGWFFHCCDTFCGWMKGSLGVTVHVNFSDRQKGFLLTYRLFIDTVNVRRKSDTFMFFTTWKAMQ